jgi:hypothetical protein
LFFTGKFHFPPRIVSTGIPIRPVRRFPRAQPLENAKILLLNAVLALHLLSNYLFACLPVFLPPIVPHCFCHPRARVARFFLPLLFAFSE